MSKAATARPETNNHVKVAEAKSATPGRVETNSSPGRDKNIELALSAITKQFGEGSIMRLGSNAKMKVETMSTGSLAIDLALGVGGLPLGRIIEIKLGRRIHTCGILLSGISEVWRN